MSVKSTDNTHRTQCLNCDTQLTGLYCALCGQKHIEGALTIGYFLKSFVDAMTDTDSRVWRTFIDLVTKPGYVAKRYVSGSRMQYINPLRLCLVIIGSYLAVLALNGWIAPVVDNALMQTKVIENDAGFFGTAFKKAWYDLYSQHRLFIYLGSIPVAAVAIRWGFFKSGYNYVATLIMLLFVGALYSFYGILLVSIYTVFEFEFFAVNRKVVEGVIGFIVYFQSVKLFYDYGWLKSILSTFWIFALLMIAAYFVTFTTSLLIVSWN